MTILHMFMVLKGLSLQGISSLFGDSMPVGYPYRCEIGAFVKDGDNELRVDVTSTWFNRLAYDSGLPEKDRKTWTIAAPPRPTGLFGSVTLRR